MRTEDPVLARCCYCLPLRRGLLAWGYLKLIVTTFLLCVIVALSNFIGVGWEMKIIDYILIVVMIFLALDVIANVVFVFGAHQKNLKLLKPYYFYSMFFLAITSLAMVLYVMVIVYERYGYINIEFFFHLAVHTSVFWLILLLQGYVLVLQKSLIVKINSPFERLVNNTTEAKPSVAIEDPQEEKLVFTKYLLNDLKA